MKAIMNKYRLAILAGLLAAGGATALQAATLNVMQNEPPRSMDPGDQTATFTDTVLKPMYEGLVDLSPDFKIAPALATAWKVSDDGKVWTFTLRKTSLSMTARRSMPMRWSPISNDISTRKAVWPRVRGCATLSLP